MELIDRTCPLCSNDSTEIHCESNLNFSKLDEFAFSSRKIPEGMHHRMKLCPNCDLLYADPAPAPSNLSTEYENTSFDSSEEARCAAHTYRKYMPADLKKGKALDIGCGGGEFISELVDYGFSPAEGIEPSPAAIVTAAPNIKPLIKNGMFAEENYVRGSYSFVSCFQTLEHVYDPLYISKSIYNLLQPGGALYIVSHNFRGSINRLFKTKSPIFDIEHMQLFSPKSMEIMLNKAGFTKIKKFPIWNSYPLHYWIKLFPLPKKLKTQIIKFSKTIKLGYWKIPLPVGNYGMIAYK